MEPPGADVVLVRHGELGVKSDQVRRKMEGRLRDNIAAMLADRGLDRAVEARRNRLFVHADDPAAATEAVTDVFGVVSASPATTVDPTLDAICDALSATAHEHYDGGTFAIRARRAGDESDHDFASTDIETEGGSAAWEAIDAVGGDPVVDLDDPDFQVFVECRPDRAYVFLEKREGPGGLPLGTQRPVVALVSGGIDSPVAAWEMMRRGCPVIPVYVDLGDYGGPDHRARARATVAALRRYAPNEDLDLRVVHGGPVVADLVAEMGKHRMLGLRRFMVAAAERIAEREDAVGIVTGEAIGQKSSQTSANLAVTDAAVDLPVHRPNLTVDKNDVTDSARAIGTFQESTIPTGCNRVAPTYPETNARPEAVVAAEPVGLLERARRLADEAEVVPVTAPGDAATDGQESPATDD